MLSGRLYLVAHRQVMGGRFRFRSDSEALLDVVEAAFGECAPHHRFPGAAPEFDVELRLLPHRQPASGGPPSVRTKMDGDLLYGIMDDCNYVLISPKRRRARIVASADMLDNPYHLRYELVEFAVFVLAARCQGLVPLHAACVGHGGRGLLLLGASGAGKSTLALHGLLQGLDFLSEDAVFVRPDDMLATGVANFLHVHSNALEGVEDAAARRWLAGSPVIRRRSGVEKFEADLRQAPAPARLAAAPVQVVGAVILSDRVAGQSRAWLAPVAGEDIPAALCEGQSYAVTQPGWLRFEHRMARSRVHYLHRGRHPGSSVDALRELLD